MINRVFNEVLYISYSRFFDLPIPWNAVETYETACKSGFNGIKGDVQPTADGKLVMCHYGEFRFDENGRVLEFKRQQCASEKKICDMTYNECKRLEFASEEIKEHLGYYPNVSGLEDLIRVCRNNSKFPYITVRDEQIEVVVNEIFRLLEKYNMTKQCIINSFNYETLKAVRDRDADICISHVQRRNAPLTKEMIDTAASLGNCVVCAFWAMDMPEILDDMYEKSKDAIAYAKEKNVPLHLAQVSNTENLKLGIERGFTGFQCRSSHCIL